MFYITYGYHDIEKKVSADNKRRLIKNTASFCGFKLPGFLKSRDKSSWSGFSILMQMESAGLDILGFGSASTLH